MSCYISIMGLVILLKMCSMLGDTFLCDSTSQPRSMYNLDIVFTNRQLVHFPLRLAVTDTVTFIFEHSSELGISVL
jgi:hypothetical protein